MTTKSQADVFVATIVRPALNHIALPSEAAEQLLLGTALVESRLVHRRQIGGGPARGFFQMEPATHDDIWSNFLEYRPSLRRAAILSVGKIAAPHCTKDVILRIPAVPPRANARAQQLEHRWNLFQALMALNEKTDAKVEWPLAPGPYMERGSTGERELKYCNAYVDGKALKAGQAP